MGSYFIRYALVANSGGQDRPTQTSAEKVEHPQNDLGAESQKQNHRRDTLLFSSDTDTESIQVTAKDGAVLKGHLYRQKQETDLWMIVVHGYQSSETEAQSTGAGFFERGYNILTYSLRGHEPSGGKYITMGAKDKDDLLAWTDFLVQKYPQSKIVFHGTSMGGATVLLASGETLPQNVVAVIDDCGYSDLWSIFERELKLRFGLPTFPVLHMANFVGRFKAGFSIRGVKPIDAVRKATVPILFIHTTGDDFVPASMTEELYQAKTQGIREKYLVEGFNHAQAKKAEGDRYFQKIDQFVREKALLH